jgi:hypothetical protein
MKRPIGPSSSDRAGARSDEDADRRAREPGHEGESDADEPELLLVLGDDVRHPDGGRHRIPGDGHSRDPTRGDEHSPTHLAEQQEPGREPPPSDRYGERRHQEESEPDAVAEEPAQAARHRHVEQERDKPGRAAGVSARLVARRSSPGAQVDPLQRRRERRRVEEGQHQAEDAGRPADVVARGEGLLRECERVAPHTEPAGQGEEDRGADVRRHERGYDDHQREERHEGLAGECHAAIDELGFEHALPHAPQQRLLGPSANCVDPIPCRSDGLWKSARLAHTSRASTSPLSGGRTGPPPITITSVMANPPSSCRRTLATGLAHAVGGAASIGVGPTVRPSAWCRHEG